MRVVEEVTSGYRDLNCVINNAGVQRVHDFATDEEIDEKALDEEIETNFTGLVRMCGALVSFLRTKDTATIVNVSSGLALIPLSRFPVYCATKAAVHSFTMSLRHQLRNTGVKVIELIPPYVATELGNTARHSLTPGGPPPLPLNEFITAAMEGLASGADEVAVGTAKMRLDVVQSEAVRNIFARMNS